MEEDFENDGYFEVKETINVATRALDLYRSKITNPEPGSVLSLEFTKGDTDGWGQADD